MSLSPDDLTKLWRATLGDTGADKGWPTLSGGATYRGASDGIAPLVQATLSGQQTVGGGTLSGGSTVGGAGGGAASGVSTSQLGLGGFQLKEEIGRGGMGVVWRARQESLARDIAVKLIRPEAANERTRQGFVAEALVNGVLDHPNIVPVHEMGTTAGGEVFLAMKLVGGTSWDRLLHPRDDAERDRATTYDRDKHLGVLDAVANAIAFAHSKGIVHRDLKPENVMVGAYGEVLVMDWGIAVDIRTKPDPADSRAVHKSAIRSPAGTPNYMAPELAEGRGDDIGPWTDVYLLGGILHELLTGRPPHRGNSLMALLLAAATSAPPAFDAQVPTGLADICRRALARDHHARYQDVPAFQAALAEYRKHRESENVASTAETALRRTTGRDATKLGGAERSALYGDFAEAVAGYRQALALWDGNDSARRGERDARLAYAGAARTAGDLGLAEAQAAALPTGDRDADALRTAITSDRVVADRAVRAARRNRGLLLGAAGLIVAGSVAGFFLVEQERARTVEQRDKAVTAEQDAARQRDAAVVAEGKAVEQERRARTALASTLIDQGTAQAGQGLNLAALDPLWRAIDTAPPDDATSTLRADAWRLWRLVAAGAMGSAGELRLTPPPALDPAKAAAQLLDAVPGPGGQVASLWHLGERQTVPGNDEAYTSVVKLRIEHPGTATAPRDHEMVGVQNAEGLLWLDGVLIVGVTWEPQVIRQQLVGLDPANFSQRWALPGGYGRPYAVDATSFSVEFRYGWLRCSSIDGRVLSRTITKQLTGEDDYHDLPTWCSPVAGWIAVGETAGHNRIPHLLRLHHGAEPDRYLSPTERMTERPVVPESPHVRLTPPSPDELFREVIPSGDGGRIVVVAQGANINRLLVYSSLDGGLLQVLDDQLPRNARIASVSPSGDAVWVTVPDGRSLLYASGATTITTREIVPQQEGSEVTDLSGDGRRLVRFKAPSTVRLEQVDDGKLVHEHQVPTGHRFGGTSLDGTALIFIGTTGIQLVDSADGRLLGRVTIPPLVPGGDYEANPFSHDTGAEPDPTAPADAPEKKPRPTSEEPATPAQIAEYLAEIGVVVALAEDRRSVLVYSDTSHPWGRFSLPEGKPLAGGVELPMAYDTNNSRRTVGLRQVGTAVLIDEDLVTANIDPNAGSQHRGFITRDAGATAINLSDDFGSAVGALRAPIAISGGAKGASVWDLRSGRLLRHLGSGAGRALAIDPDGRFAATLAGSTIIVWDVSSGRRLTLLPAPVVEWVSDWRMTEGGRALRWVEGGVREFTLIDGREPPTQKPAVIPPAATVVRSWPQPVTRPPTLEALTARLQSSREAGAPISGLRRSAALGLAAIPPTLRLTVAGSEGFVAEVSSWPPPPAVTDGGVPPVPAVLGSYEPQQVDGAWQITMGSGVSWRYVPPGEYRFDPEKTVVRLSTGFWAMTAALTAKQYYDLEYPAKGVLDACLPEDQLPAGNDGNLLLRLRSALLLTDPLLPVRLPSSAEAIALIQRFGAIKNTWLSDRWMGDAGRAPALDPWGAWDRIALGAASASGLPVLDAVPALSAEGTGVTAVLYYEQQGKRVTNFEGSVTAAWSVVLVAPAW